MDFATPPATPRMIAGRAAALAFMALGTLVAVAYGPTDVAASVSAEGPAASTAAPDTAVPSTPIVADADADYGFVSTEIEVEVPQVRIASMRVGVDNPPPQRIAGDVVLAEASKWVGSPYLYGGSTPSGFDCSGFTSFVYGNLGISVPRSSSDYWNFGVVVKPEDALPGDFIVLEGHVGIYAGNGRIIDSPRPGTTVQYRTIPFTDYFFVRVP